MWWKLILNSFRRDARRKLVAVFAVALATCLATFLLHWSLNLGDRIQEDLRAYGTNIVILPQGDSLSIAGDTTLTSDRYLKSSELGSINKIFWRNQIVGMAPMLPQNAFYEKEAVLLVGTEFGKSGRFIDFSKVAPYAAIQGRWPQRDNEIVAGSTIAERFGWKTSHEVSLRIGQETATFSLVGIIKTGGPEEQQILAELKAVQSLSGRPGEFKQLLVSALVTPTNPLFLKHLKDPESLTPQEEERYYCTPYISSVADEIAKAFSGAEPRILRQVSQSEEKIVKKVNWLMILVTLAGLVASSLTMTSTTTAMIMERRKELALMKAIGSGNAFLFFYLFTEVLILGIVGSAGGYGIGSFLSVLLSGSVFESGIELKWIVLPIVFLIGIVIILFGSFWPLRQAMHLEPAHTLKDL